MISSMMANTTQDQQKDAAEKSTINQEKQMSKEVENSQESDVTPNEGLENGKIEKLEVVDESCVRVQNTIEGDKKVDGEGKEEAQSDGPIDCEHEGHVDGVVEGDVQKGNDVKVDNAGRDDEKVDDVHRDDEKVNEVDRDDGKVDDVDRDDEKVDDIDRDDEKEDEKVDDVDRDDEKLDEEEEEENEEEEEEEVLETKIETQLDHDQDRRNPQYIPKGGAFYEHDNRTSLEDVENKDPQDVDKSKKVWKESKETERWLHDWYKESEQQPKTKAEILETYGYDIRNEEAPPRARRRRKYGRGPDKYDRNWEDEQAYMMKQNMTGRRGKKKSFGKDEFPPLPNRKNDASVEKTPPKSPGWKKEEESVKKPQKSNNYERTHQINRNDYSGTPNGVNSINSNKRNLGQNKNIIKEEIKPFRQHDKTKWKNNTFRRGKPEEVFKTNKLKPASQGESQTPRNVESNKNYTGDSDVTHVTEGFSQMTFHNKHSSIRDNRQDPNELNEQEMDSPANRLNPKRYSKNRKGFTGFFPPEEIVEIDPLEMKQLQQEQQQKSPHVNLQQQPLNIQSVIRRYPGTYNGNPGYIAPRQLITGMPQQGMSPQGLQQALSPQGIPQQALSPQVPGLQTIELQQGSIPPQPNFVSSLYMDPHYGPPDMMAPYTGYTPYSANQPSEIYQPPGGITYYNTECQSSNPIRAPPARRQKAAIPILPPPE